MELAIRSTIKIKSRARCTVTVQTTRTGTSTRATRHTGTDTDRLRALVERRIEAKRTRNCRRLLPRSCRQRIRRRANMASISSAAKPPAEIRAGDSRLAQTVASMPGRVHPTCHARIISVSRARTVAVGIARRVQRLEVVLAQTVAPDPTQQLLSSFELLLQRAAVHTAATSVPIAPPDAMSVQRIAALADTVKSSVSVPPAGDTGCW